MFHTKNYILLYISHVIFVAMILKFFNTAAPTFIQYFFSSIVNFVVCLFIARYTFVFTKQMFLNKKVRPHKKAVLITGCDSGFGHGLAVRLDSRGFQVFATCLFPAGEGAEALRNQCSDRLKVLEMDVTKDDSVKTAFQYVKDNLGDSVLWAIVNNAGTGKGFVVDHSSLQDFKDTMEVNGFGMVRVTKTFLPLLKQSTGRIVNVTSYEGRVAYPRQTPYVMSKFAAAGFSDALRMEMDVWGIRVIQIEPELFQTMITNAHEVLKRIDEKISTLDPASIEEYGEKYFEGSKSAALHLLSNYSSPKIYRVVDAMENAVAAEYPSISYRPCRNYVYYVLTRLTEIMPHALTDMCSETLYAFFPKPKAA